MQVRSQSFHLPKAGNSAEEYEDACRPEGAAEARGSFRCAMADGATETSFSGLWANLLVEAWVRGQMTERSLLAGLPPLQGQWLRDVSALPLSWYAEEKIRSGAFSSFLGVSLAPPRPGGGAVGRWRAVAVGDSCLFQVRGNRLLGAFPLQRSEQFTNRPCLLSSNPGANSGMAAQVTREAGRWLPGDVLLCMTDALGQWFLHAAEGGDTPWRALCPVLQQGTHTLFADWITELRRHQNLRNDDVTLLVVHPG